MSSIARTVAAAIAIFSSFHGTNALWRLQCEGIAGMARIDPLVNPGKASSHMHTIKGSGAFSPSSTAADLLNSNCTSCQVGADHSAYWTAGLYFRDNSGTLTAVPEISGHISYYKYTPCYINGVLTYPSAMPNGLQMISGDPLQRNFSGLSVPDPPQPWTGKDATQAALRQKAIGFNCMNYQAQPEPSLFRHFLPEKSYLDAHCPDGLRLELLFPQCWNGELDSPDHKSHLAFPSATINGGTCPPGYDKLINQIFYETIFATNTFAAQEGTFVLSDGDPTGYGYHGDIIVAWEEGVLDQATQMCGPDTSPSDIGFSGITSSCPVLNQTLQTVEEQQSCQISIPDMVSSDNIHGPVNELPGNVKIQAGPGYASYGTGSGGPVVPPSSVVPTLSYTAGSSGTNPEDGNIFVQKSTATITQPLSSSTSVITTSEAAVTTSAASVEFVSSPSLPSSTPVVATSVAPETSSSIAAVTSAPANSDVSALSTLTTIFSTSGQEAFEVIVVEQEITVTVPGAGATPLPAAKVKREHEHLVNHQKHKHSRRHQHHLGRNY